MNTESYRDRGTNAVRRLVCARTGISCRTLPSVIEYGLPLPVVLFVYVDKEVELSTGLLQGLVTLALRAQPVDPVNEVLFCTVCYSLVMLT